jgi:hypothetical protein
MKVERKNVLQARSLVRYDQQDAAMEHALCWTLQKELTDSQDWAVLLLVTPKRAVSSHSFTWRQNVVQFL